MIDKIEILEEEMLKYEQAECPVIHRFGPGVYIREVHIKAGTFAVGHYQKTEHLNIFLEGAVLMVNEDGTKTEVRAPQIFTSQPGRKVGHILEDMTWLNVYSTNEKNITKLEEMFLDKSEAWKESQAKLDELEFNNAIKELGYTPKEVREVSERAYDLVDMPYGSYKFKVGKSIRDGQGIFATSDIFIDELIGVARLGENRTPLGRFTNHSDHPNSKMEIAGTDIVLKSLTTIDGCRGGRDGEEITVDYRQAVSVNFDLRNKLCQA